MPLPGQLPVHGDWQDLHALARTEPKWQAPQKKSRRRAGEARLARPGRQHLEFNCQLDGWVGEWVGDEGASKK